MNSFQTADFAQQMILFREKSETAAYREDDNGRPSAYRKQARTHLRKAMKLAGIQLCEEFTNMICNIHEVKQALTEPAKGARIVEMYGTHEKFVAIRKRPRNGGYEVLWGRIDYGHKMSNAAQRYAWSDPVIATVNDLSRAVEMAREISGKDKPNKGLRI